MSRKETPPPCVRPTRPVPPPPPDDPAAIITYLREALAKAEAELDRITIQKRTGKTPGEVVGEMRARIAELEAKFKHFLSCAATVKQENTDEWMEYIDKEIQAAAKSLGLDAAKGGGS